MNLSELTRRARLASQLGFLDYTVALCTVGLEISQSCVELQCILGQAFLEKNDFSSAESCLRNVLQCDGENVAALVALGVVYVNTNRLAAAGSVFARAYELDPSNEQASESLRRLATEGQTYRLDEVPRLAVARWRITTDDSSQAALELDLIARNRPNDLVVRGLYAEALWRSGRLAEVERECSEILSGHPACLKARILLGACLLRDDARAQEGVEQIHHALAGDPTNSVAGPILAGSPFELPKPADHLHLRSVTIPKAPPDLADALAAAATMTELMESNHRFNWRPPYPPEPLHVDWVEQNGSSLPASLHDSSLGDDAGAGSDGAESVDDLRKGLVRTAEDLVKPANVVDTPSATSQITHLILTSRSGLIGRFGAVTTGRLTRRLEDYAGELAAQGHPSAVVYFDDSSSTERVGQGALDQNDPVELKRLVDRIDSVAAGGGLENLLIVGGPDIVPMFEVPNPAIDDDSVVRTDTPYVSPGWNFLSVSRGVGRLPDGQSSDPALLLTAIDSAAEALANSRRLIRPSGCLTAVAELLRNIAIQKPAISSFGMSTAVWQQASSLLYRLLPGAWDLEVSPPIVHTDLDPDWLQEARLLYFNLHGTKTGPAWYGQRANNAPAGTPFMPVALTPDLVARSAAAGSIVFTEACYGVDLVDRTAENSNALAFLAAGSAAVVGATGIAYGSSAAPLSNADLICRGFWNFLLAGYSAGEALIHSKSEFINEMMRRQGYLDEDDQKTWLQFNLLGEPAVRLFAGSRGRKAAPAVESLAGAEATVLCSNVNHPEEAPGHQTDLARIALEFLDSHDQDLRGGRLNVHSRGSCDGSCGQLCHVHVPKSRNRLTPVTSITAQKRVRADDGSQIPRYARLTVDSDGRVVKAVVSR